jgi:hypothetical protein
MTGVAQSVESSEVSPKRLFAVPGKQHALAILAIMLFPLVLHLFVVWTETPLGAIDAWIYRGIGPNYPNALQMFPHFYYTSRLYILLPSYVLSSLFTPFVAHILLSFGIYYITAFSLYAFVCDYGKRRTAFLVAILCSSCLFLLRSAGWGYVDGYVMAFATFSLFCIGRALLASARRWTCFYWAALAGAGLTMMLETHPMSLSLGTSVGWFFLLFVFSPRIASTKRALWLIPCGVGAGGILILLAGCGLSYLLFGKFLFFQPTVEEALAIKDKLDTWTDRDLVSWLSRADWLVVQLTAALVAASRFFFWPFRRRSMTRLELFAYTYILGTTLLLGYLELFTTSFFLRYCYYSSYFVVPALLALACALGEGANEPFSVRQQLGTLAIFLVLVPVTLLMKQPGIAVETTPYQALGIPSAGTFNMVFLQAGVGVLFVLVANLISVCRPTGWLHRPFLVLALVCCGLLTITPISEYPSHRGSEVAQLASCRSVAHLQQQLANRIGPHRPLFWFHDNDPAHSAYHSLHCAFLTLFTRLEDQYLVAERYGAYWLPNSVAARPPSVAFWQVGQPIVICLPSPEALPAELEALDRKGMTLDVVEKFPLPYESLEYWVFLCLVAKTHPVRDFEPGSMPSDIPTATAREDRGRKVRHVPAGQAGFATYGMRTLVPPGRYRIDYTLKRSPGAVTEREQVVLSVYSGEERKTFSQLVLKGSDFDPAGAEKTYSLSLDTDQEIRAAQFRVWTSGECAFTVCEIHCVGID